MKHPRCHGVESRARIARPPVVTGIRIHRVYQQIRVDESHFLSRCSRVSSSSSRWSAQPQRLVEIIGPGHPPLPHQAAEGVRPPQRLVEIIGPGHFTHENRLQSVRSGHAGNPVIHDPRAQRLVDHRLERLARPVDDFLELSGNAVVYDRCGSQGLRPMACIDGGAIPSTIRASNHLFEHHPAMTGARSNLDPEWSR